MPRKVYKEKRKIWDKKYRETHKVERAESDKRYAETNKEKLKLKRAEYYQKNKEKIKTRTKAYALENKDKTEQWKKESAKRNPETARINKRRRRAREAKTVSEKYTTQQVLDLYGTDCHICFKPINLEAPRQCGKPGWQHALHIDHLIPISKGGFDTLDNVRPAHGLCNIRKWARIQ